jgi:Domain of unknown function (DUF4397)
MHEPSPLFTRRRALLTLGAAATGPVLAGCGGGDDDDEGSANVRAINLSTDIASADLFFDDNRVFSGVASVPGAEALVDYVRIGNDDYTVKLKKAGDGATLLSGTYSIAKDQNYTAVIWGRETAPRLSTLPEDADNDDIDGGNSRLRIFSATQDTGTVDVYLTTTNADLGNTAASIAGVPSGQISGYRDFSSGSYRLRITGAGDSNDLRLDIASITLKDRRHATLILTPGPGGVLLNGRVIEQQGPSISMPNTQTRLRVVAGADGAGNVAVAVEGRTVAGGLRSPSVGPYQLVDAGDAVLTVRLNGTTVGNASTPLAAGADYTLLVYGAGETRLVADDNRLPSNTGRIKMRLLHGAAGVDPLTASLDYLALVSDQPQGTVSAYFTANANSSARVDVTAASAAAPVYSAEDVNLQPSGVYTLFVLGGNSGATGVIRKER